MFDAIKQVSTQKLEPITNAIEKYVVESQKLHTKFLMLLSEIQTKVKMFLPDALE